VTEFTLFIILPPFFFVFFALLIIMSASNIIGSLTFCPECGNLLDMAGSDDDIILCNQCGCAFRTAGIETTEVVTTSSERSFQSSLKAKRHLVQQNKAAQQARAIVNS
jgi:DNA-directed RNA polymerase I subunit RPA12